MKNSFDICGDFLNLFILISSLSCYLNESLDDSFLETLFLNVNID